MRAGGKRRLIVPAELGYGAEGRERYVPPNTDVIFDIELREIRDTPPPTPTATP
jgi:peptidylprolyl isomerase